MLLDLLFGEVEIAFHGLYFLGEVGVFGDEEVIIPCFYVGFGWTGDEE
jgi:hypothetical protein